MVNDIMDFFRLPQDRKQEGVKMGKKMFLKTIHKIKELSDKLEQEGHFISSNDDLNVIIKPSDNFEELSYEFSIGREKEMFAEVVVKEEDVKNLIAFLQKYTKE